MCKEPNNYTPAERSANYTVQKIHLTLKKYTAPRSDLFRNSKMSHPCCVCINNRCGYQSITQQYLKRCLIKDEVNYMFRPNVAITRFTSESTVVLLYRIGMDMS